MSERLFIGLALCVPIVVNALLRQPLFRPAGLIAAMWAAALLGQELLVPDFVFAHEAGWTILLVVGCFIAGDFWVMYQVRRYGPIALGSGVVPVRRMKIATIACGAFAVVGASWQFALYARHIGGVGELLSAGGAVRALWAEHEISIPFAARVLASFGHAGVVLALTAWSRIGRRWWMALPFLGVIIFSVSLMGRAGLLMMAVGCFLITYYRDVTDDSRDADRRLFRRLLPACAIVAVIFGAGELIRAADDVEVGIEARTFASYAFGGPAALSAWLRPARLGSELAWGAQSFDSIAGILGVKEQVTGIYDDYAQLSVRRDDLGNVYTVVRPLLEDFGLLGACVFMLALGAMAGLVFERMRAGSLAARALMLSLGLYIVFTVITPLSVFNSWILSAITPPLVLARQNVNQLAPEL
jgi:oligosaccharide repeat unit polymerase